MTDYLDVETAIKKAASLARGDRLAQLQAICRTQRSISTRQLSQIVERLAASDRVDGQHFAALAEFVRRVRG